MENICFEKVNLKDGFWLKRQQTVENSSMKAIYGRFVDTGRFDSLKCGWKEGMANKPHFYWESEIAKFLEAAAYILQKHENNELEAIVDEAVEDMISAQDSDGYFNTYMSVMRKGERLENRLKEELYTAGHLIEAAVAYDRATGKRAFLDAMCRYADYIYRVFMEEKSLNYHAPHHPEIELALVKLYNHTGEKRYLDLSRHFVNVRGTQAEDRVYLGTPYHVQEHLPVREQTTAEGHAVTCMYLFSAAADLAHIDGDGELKQACGRLYDNVTCRRMYVTGGVGASAVGESFSIDYHLPNLNAYAETCAAIGLAFFSMRMFRLDPDSKYADAVERAMYNGILSGVSLDGKTFFYQNPLEIRPDQFKISEHYQFDGIAFKNLDIDEEEYFKRKKPLVLHNRTGLPETQRSEVFDVSCCPPNIARFVSSIGNTVCSHGEDIVYVHQYMSSETCFELGGRNVSITQNANYPADGEVRIQSQGVKKLALRVPGWCSRYGITVNGAYANADIVKGYAILALGAGQSDIVLSLEMEVRLVEANPLVQEDAGRAAVTYGPIVYCCEGVDNGSALRDLRIDAKGACEIEFDPELGANMIRTDGYRRSLESFNGKLYDRVADRLERFRLRLIPYFAFANRGESEMQVWLLLK